MNRSTDLAIVLAISLLFFAFPQAAHASVTTGIVDLPVGANYIDPGTGSIIIQALIGALVAGVAVIGVYRARVKMFFSNLFGGRRRENGGGDGEERE